MSVPRTIPIAVLSDPVALYDFFMRQIEPDLVKANLPTLDAPYAKETAEERKERYARYSAAYLAFDELVAKFTYDLEKRNGKVAMAMDIGAAVDDMDTESKTMDAIDEQLKNS